MKSIAVAFLLSLLVSCHSSRTGMATTQKANDQQEKFWQELKQLCGKAFEGTVAAAPANDTTFKNKTLLMHVRACEENKIRIPFMVGNNRSRTWVFTKTTGKILLKHDHRHEDGKEDSITQYGGWTSNSGTTTVQYFPADQHTVDILPAAGGNIWWVELVPGKYFTYNLRRMGTDRLFSIRFDLNKPVTIPEAPWGWKD
jgi:hypothetical protein